jgi:hypothetical protein
VERRGFEPSMRGISQRCAASASDARHQPGVAAHSGIVVVDINHQVVDRAWHGEYLRSKPFTEMDFRDFVFETSATTGAANWSAYRCPSPSRNVTESCQAIVSDAGTPETPLKLGIGVGCSGQPVLGPVACAGGNRIRLGHLPEEGEVARPPLIDV